MIAMAIARDNVEDRWDDIARLPFVDQELVRRHAFHDDVAYWIESRQAA